MVSHALRGQGIFGTYDSAVIPGLHVVEGGQTSTGVCMPKRGCDAAVGRVSLV